jgi:transcriptional regulatory protein LevR
LLDKKSRAALGESIIECIETKLNSSYGENVSQVIYYYFKIRFGLAKSEIISHAKQFEEILEDIFGTGIACQVIKRTICKALEHQFEIKRETAAFRSS